MIANECSRDVERLCPGLCERLGDSLEMNIECRDASTCRLPSYKVGMFGLGSRPPYQARTYLGFETSAPGRWIGYADKAWNTASKGGLAIPKRYGLATPLMKSKEPLHIIFIYRRNPFVVLRGLMKIESWYLRRG